ncbi:MAG: MATE family efflux transporter [Leptolyngbyaceae cyanobacterium RM2_2_4]|nr:MATE family efflux transporter [Leptolyngbyaceae cyanobacterium SM1_4_3]NJN89359.1 MATE family efflux transporter [Leptolyngbyaceae cyanobacterium SL_5_14]NJO50091.1 MATE family efflux transporter [Leptolyngbyaceae cyanobacterium RM2_2_4]
MTVISNRLGVQTEAREFLKLAIPLAGAQVAQAGTGFVDTVMMGWLGQDVIAAGGLATILFMAFMMTGVGLVSAVSPLVAEAYGSGQTQRIGQLARQGLWVALLLSIPAMQIIAHLNGLMRQFGQTETTVTLADTYLNVMAWGLFPAIAFAALRSCIAALSKARPVMFIVFAATLFNIVGNYVLGFGKFGFPNLGIAGLAVASTGAHWIMFLSLLVYMLWHQPLRNYSLFRSLHRFEPRIMQQLLWVGGPIGIAAILEYGLYTTVSFFMGALGTPALAANQVVQQTVVIIFMVPLGMSFAATVRIGQWFGQRDWKQIQRAAFVSVGLAILFMLITGIVLFAYPRQIIGLYLDLNDPANANALNISISLMRIAAFGLIFDGIQRTTNGVLQGLQDTRIPVLLGTAGYWGIGLTTSYLLGFHTPLAGMGVWIGTYVGLAAAAIAFLWRFRLISQQRC